MEFGKATGQNKFGATETSFDKNGEVSRDGADNYILWLADEVVVVMKSL